MHPDGKIDPSDDSEDSRLPFSPAIGCLVSVLLGLSAAGILTLAVSLASGRELRANVGELSEVRLWFVQDDRNSGIGLSRSIAVEYAPNSGEKCVETTVSFFLWRTDGSAKNAKFCECYRKVGDTWLVNDGCGS